MFEIGPQIFNRIQLRRVRRQENVVQRRCVGKMLANLLRTVSTQLVSDQNDGSIELVIQLADKVMHSHGVNIGVGMEAKI